MTAFDFIMLGVTFVALCSAYYLRAETSRRGGWILLLVLSTFIALPMWAAKIMVWLA